VRPAAGPRRLAAGLAALAVLTLPTGCGGEESPAEQVPALDARLDAVDAAVAAHDDAAARRAVNRLERTAMAAARSGDLDQADLDEITAAGEALYAALGDAPDEATETPSPSPSPQPPATEEPEEDKPEKPEKPGHDKPGHDKPRPPKHDKHEHDKGPKPGKGHGH
jgi:outer membrane biosynthesis protein TonB